MVGVIQLVALEVICERGNEEIGITVPAYIPDALIDDMVGAVNGRRRRTGEYGLHDLCGGVGGHRDTRADKRVAVDGRV